MSESTTKAQIHWIDNWYKINLDSQEKKEQMLVFVMSLILKFIWVNIFVNLEKQKTQIQTKKQIIKKN